jgi:gamma-glutamyl hercynylcysteine S-oxide synthase
MMHDTLLYDAAAGLYTVPRLLGDFDTRYGGVDGVLLWHSYPNIGVDDRSQFDMLQVGGWVCGCGERELACTHRPTRAQDMPGGVSGLRDMVAQFHAAGVRVGFPVSAHRVASAPRHRPPPHSPIRPSVEVQSLG